jgi:hypothetical protein
VLGHRAKTVVAREPAAEAGLEPAGLEVDLVVHDEERLRRNLEVAHGRAD